MSYLRVHSVQAASSSRLSADDDAVLVYSAVRDAASASRDDDAGAVRHRKDVHHSPAHEGDDRLRRSSQRDENEPEGDHGAADVRPSRRRHQRLDGRHLLGTVEAHSQDQERSDDACQAFFYWRQLRGVHQKYYLPVYSLRKPLSI